MESSQGLVLRTAISPIALEDRCIPVDDRCLDTAIVIEEAALGHMRSQLVSNFLMCIHTEKSRRIFNYLPRVS